jgi:aryl-alcohol dehydrogenase-like predicted oxidoreductase
MPRFTGENAASNERLVASLQALAAEKGVSATQLAIAWVLAKHPTLIAVVGARTRAQLDESLGALKVTLSPAEVTRLEEAVPAASVAGGRYPDAQLRTLDSER